MLALADRGFTERPRTRSSRHTTGSGGGRRSEARSAPVGCRVLDPVALLVEAVSLAVGPHVGVESVGPAQLLRTGGCGRFAVHGRPLSLHLQVLRLVTRPVVEDVAWLFDGAKVFGPGVVGRRAIVGTPDAVRSGLEEVARDYGAEELIVVTITYDHAARRRSYELIAEAFVQPAAAEAA